MAIPVVSVEELERLWQSNLMPEKRRTGVLSELIVYQTAAGDPCYAGARSNIVKLFTPNGRHIGTIHEIVHDDGRVMHSHPKDYTLRDCSRVRLIERGEV